ncbi:divalent metal cation transporter [Ktedonosporobacter rubrisoli]|uniref:Divalent metal cation transporter n=1 Tax=Ktedonosporobacter rubrisoli TaxID=2509675 RepID=A0A4P6K3G6_KTERU|nr:divalent metal cation transporter [Ktedonosporobacter rubrisoli]QBD82684.1 divalent metal cation transporter [Ktedonosporobacter rubrisoli]
MAGEKHNDHDPEVVPGMQVEATEGDLGEHDVSSPKIAGVEKDRQGHVKTIEVSKGIFFKKKINVPVERIEAVEPVAAENGTAQKMIVDAQEEELTSLTASGPERLPARRKRQQEKRLSPGSTTEEGLERGSNTSAAQPPRAFWHVIGPGLLSGTSGNDPSAVTVYAVDGANVGYGHLWLMLLTTPLYFAVQFACARIGRVSQKGLAQLLGEYYGRPLAIGAALLLAMSNIALLAADLVAIGSGFELITGVSWAWFVVPVTVGLWYLTVYRTFEAFKKIFLTMSFVFVAYVLTAFFTHAQWSTVLVRTFVPHLGFDFASISSAGLF